MNARLYLGTLTLEIEILHWRFSRHHVDHKTVPVVHGFTLWRSKILCEVRFRPPHRGPATRWLTATFAMSMNGQAVSSHLTEASSMISSNSHRSDLSCTRRRTACLLSAEHGERVKCRVDTVIMSVHGSYRECKSSVCVCHWR